jgi:ABC-2 type transport system ATP-binding protein
MSVRIEHLSVSKGKKQILSDITLSIPKGTIAGLIGPSGSGKTTLMRTMLGVQLFQKGTVTVLDAPAGSSILRRKIGYVTQTPAVYGDLTVSQNMQYFASVVGADKKQINPLLARVGLREQSSQLTSTLSGGQLARTSLAVALLGDPEFLILDEPTVGQDPLLREELWKLFQELAADGKTVVVSSHIMNEASKCDQLIIIREGKILKSTTAAALRKETGLENLDDAFLKLVRGDGGKS